MIAPAGAVPRAPARDGHHEMKLQMREGAPKTCATRRIA
jgi:hypothetical protein